ncbi:MAG: hypothetical protein JW712_00620 [Dehalococcoidales bacterium]|nr:hypothetical protein [Dehalococcoidales bacterium]
MPKKYHINVQTTPLEREYIYKFRIVRGDNCINCGRCTKVCIYEAHKRREDDPRRMADPDTTVCRNCFRCIQECPRGALEKSLNTDFSGTGGEYWTPDMLLSLWKQAETGSVPVSGAGYRGPFSGTGFDSMWTDMSEIVRPTRDGIHGREYISTAVDLGRRLNHLSFGTDNSLLSELPKIVSISVPVLFDITEDYPVADIQEIILQAAGQLDTSVIMKASEITSDLDEFSGVIVPRLSAGDIEKYEALIRKARLVEIDCNDEVSENLTAIIDQIKKISGAVTVIRVSAGKDVEDTVVKLAENGAEVIHIVADYRGQGYNGPAESGNRYLKDIIRSIHGTLVDKLIRDEVTLVVSGGIAMAEHVPKSMLCGADLTAIDIPLLIALGVRIYEEPDGLRLVSEGLDEIPEPVAVQRIINLVGAWHSQILEMMGAMGIRDIRRLRGETGRAMFFEDLDKETFGTIFGRR